MESSLVIKDFQSVVMDPKRPSEIKAQEEVDYTFVVGCPRSGTTLLRSIFQNHSEIAVSPELRFFFQVVSRWRRFVPLDNPVKQRQLTEYLFHKLEKFNRISDYKEITGSLSDYEEIYEKKRDEFTGFFESGTSLSVENIFGYLVKLFSDKEGSRYLVKTPANINMLPKITEVFPQTKIVHMVRDGRDVVTSLMKGKREWVSDLQTAALIWSHSIRLGKEYEERLGTKRFFRLYFEDLVTSPEKTLKELCGFLGVEFQDHLLNVKSINSSFEAAGSGFKDTSVGRYQQLLSQKEREICEDLTGPELTLMGYGRGSFPPFRKRLPANCKRQFFYIKEGFKNYFRNAERYHWIQRFFS